jgi:hypothetical protein
MWEDYLRARDDCKGIVSDWGSFPGFTGATAPPSKVSGFALVAV